MRGFAHFIRLALMGVALTACGVPIDDLPEPVEIELVETPIAEPSVTEDLQAVPIYLVEEGSITSVTRDLPPPRDAASVLESLLEGTTEPEERTGLRTSIPAETMLLGVEMDGRTAHIDLSRDFAAVGGDEEVLAVAQIVLTVTDVDGVDDVLFYLEGIPTDVPLPNGALADRPLGRAEYTSLVSP